jgi:hypothetical protein
LPQRGHRSTTPASEDFDGRVGNCIRVARPGGPERSGCPLRSGPCLSQRPADLVILDPGQFYRAIITRRGCKDLCIGEVLPWTDHEAAAAAGDYLRRSGDAFPPRQRAALICIRGQSDVGWAARIVAWGPWWNQGPRPNFGSKQVRRRSSGHFIDPRQQSVLATPLANQCGARSTNWVW